MKKKNNKEEIERLIIKTLKICSVTFTLISIYIVLVIIASMGLVL